ncbi:hypothetical protein D9619_001358 [Psilocybe cf. subviscida]|uniref:Protein kinase domain-containing protein n=1 Tax=Psilocybe cf. subviscida TaxID=2480587 RepID=A0A8H5BDT9_9AGAR|nr:hypothetical protein D9619_001358 [Psilocybe cf. subviscida]
MDYLRTLGSAAVSTLVQKSGLNLPFSLGSKVNQSEGYYSLYDATKRDDGSPVSVFEYDFSDSARRNTKVFAQNAMRKLRTTRHPDVLKFMEVVESDTTIYIMTERVRPLSTVLPQYSNKSAQEKEDWLLWGLHRISVALTFLNDQCISTHGNISTRAIFLSPSGEWKLGGFELFSNPKDEAAILYTMGGLLPGISSLSPPEVKKSGWSSVKEADPAAPDAYALGLLLHAVFNPTQPSLATAEPPHPPPSPASRGAIPTSIFPHFKKLLNPNPKGRLNAKGFLDIGMSEPSGFFYSNRLVRVCAGLDNFPLASDGEKALLLKTLKESASSFPPEFTSYRVLPSLVSALEHGGASGTTILPLLLQFGNNISPDTYPKVILEPIIKLYASPDRGLRLALLEHLPEYVEKLDKKAVSDKIFPHLQTGFADTVAVIREATVKSIILLAPKLSDRLLNNDLLRLLAKTQMDSEASIRTNTCILLGRLGPTLGYNTKRKVLVPAFSRALKDSFVHARVAGLMAFMATIDCFEVPELATKVIPNMAFALVDDEKLVRDQAFKALQLFVKKLEDHVAKMPETVIVPTAEGGPTPMPGAAPASIVDSAAGAAGSLAGWAISTLGKKIAVSDMQNPINSGLSVGLDRSTSAPDSASLSSHIGEITRPSFHKSVHSSSTIATTTNGSGSSKGKALQLGSNKIPASLSVAKLAEQVAAEEEFSASAFDADNPWAKKSSLDLPGAFKKVGSDDGNPWGSDDLIDVNADEGDWSAFESAPAVSVHTLLSSTPAFSPANPGTSWLSATDETHWGATPSQTTNGYRPRSPAGPAIQSSIKRALSPTPRSHRPQSPLSKPAQDADWDSAGGWDDTPASKPSASTPTSASQAPVSKEEKALEMARRKEERKQRIAMLKEQKKAGGKA